MPTLSATTELWFAWSEIAAEQQLAAEGWRHTAEDDIRAGRNPSNAIAQENKAALAAMAAAGAALETLGTYLATFDQVASRREDAWERFVRRARHVYPDANITADLEDFALLIHAGAILADESTCKIMRSERELGALSLAGQDVRGHFLAVGGRFGPSRKDLRMWEEWASVPDAVFEAVLEDLQEDRRGPVVELAERLTGAALDQRVGAAVRRASRK